MYQRHVVGNISNAERNNPVRAESISYRGSKMNAVAWLIKAHKVEELVTAVVIMSSLSVSRVARIRLSVFKKWLPADSSLQNVEKRLMILHKRGLLVYSVNKKRDVVTVVLKL